MKYEVVSIKYKKVFFFSLIAFIFFSMFVTQVFAHVVVRPNEVGVGAFQTFTVGVPVEKDVPTVGLRLVIPEGVGHVTPNVKQGWTIEIKTEAEGMKGDILNTGEEAPRRVSEIIWTGGFIPAGQRDEFLFSAQVPAEETTIAWKAYQTYEDGEVVAWDTDPKTISEETEDKEGDHAAKQPYSETKIVNDLQVIEDEAYDPKVASNSVLPLTLSIIALAVGGLSLWMHTKKTSKK